MAVRQILCSVRNKTTPCECIAYPDLALVLVKHNFDRRNRVIFFLRLRLSLAISNDKIAASEYQYLAAAPFVSLVDGNRPLVQ